MNGIFFSMPCLSESAIISKEKIHTHLFEKQTDKRYPEQAIQKFTTLNEQAFQFLGIQIQNHNSDNAYGIQFHSGKYIGAVPVRMPFDEKIIMTFKFTHDTILLIMLF